MDLSSKGRMCAAGEAGVRSDVLVWRYGDRSLLFKLSEHDHGIHCLAFSQDERLLATHGEEGRMIVWDMATGNIVTHCRIRPAFTIEWGGRVPDIKNRPTKTFYLATAGKAGVELHVVDPEAGTIQSQLLPPGKYSRTVTAFAFTPEYLLCATTSCDFLVFELHSKTLVRVFPAGANGVSDLFTSAPDGAITAGCGDGSVFAVTECATRLVQQIGGPVAGISARSLLTKDGHLFSTQGEIWECHTVPVTGIDARGAVAVSAGVDRMVKVWDTRSMRCTLTFDTAYHSVPRCVSLSQALLVVGFESGHAAGYDFTTGEQLFQIPGCQHHMRWDRVTACRIAPTGRFFATGGADRCVRLWDVRTRTLLSNFQKHTKEITSLAFVPSAQFLYTASADRSICLYDLTAEKLITQIGPLTSHVTDVDVAGDYMVAATQDGQVQVFCVGEGVTPRATVKTNETTGLSVAPDGTKFAVAHVDGSVSLWDVDACRRIDAVAVHSHALVDIKFFANDRILTAGGDGSLAVLTVEDTGIGKASEPSPRGTSASDGQRRRNRPSRETFVQTSPGTI
jgi:WD40 repeat protein